MTDTDIEYQPESFVTFMDDEYSTPPVTVEFDQDPEFGIIKVSQPVDGANRDKGTDAVYFDLDGAREFAERVLAMLDESESCPCDGRPVYIHDSGFTRGLCMDCDTERCDVPEYTDYDYAD